MDTKIVLLGHPNVGKSALFNQLTWRYVTVSNYPGTTVSISRGETSISRKKYTVIDTPGLYSLLPRTDDERVARQILFDGEPKILVHVVDAKNIDRMLHLTIQLLETGSKLILTLNMMDEAYRLGMNIATDILERELAIPVVKTVSTRGDGIITLKEKIHALSGA